MSARRWPWTKPAPAPEPAPKPEPEPTLSLADLAERWGFDSLAKTKRVTKSNGFPREWGNVRDDWTPAAGDHFGHRPRETDARVMAGCLEWLGPDDRWLVRDVEAWEQAFVIAAHRKADAAIIEREIAKRAVAR